jgi:hypothetical protein
LRWGKKEGSSNGSGLAEIAGARWGPFMAALCFFPATTEENDEGNGEFDGRQRKWYIVVTFVSFDATYLMLNLLMVDLYSLVLSVLRNRADHSSMPGSVRRSRGGSIVLVCYNI